MKHFPKQEYTFWQRIIFTYYRHTNLWPHPPLTPWRHLWTTPNGHSDRWFTYRRKHWLEQVSWLPGCAPGTPWRSCVASAGVVMVAEVEQNWFDWRLSGFQLHRHPRRPRRRCHIVGQKCSTYLFDCCCWRYCRRGCRCSCWWVARQPRRRHCPRSSARRTRSPRSYHCCRLCSSLDSPSKVSERKESELWKSCLFESMRYCCGSQHFRPWPTTIYIVFNLVTIWFW